jgi:malate dehydrogenase
MPKVAVIGAGQVGSTTAMRLAESGLADIALIDIQPDLARGKALDISQSLPLTASPSRVIAGGDYAIARGSDLGIITAGFPRSPGMSREDLMRKNASIVKETVQSLAEVAPDCGIIMVTNPLDEMSYLAWRLTGWDRHRIMGMAGLLDSCRFAAFIAEELNVVPGSVKAMVLGSHGDTMLPLSRWTTINGQPAAEALDPQSLMRVEERTRNAGGEIVSLLHSGSAYYAPSACVSRMAAAILRDEGIEVPASVLLEGEYGLSSVFLGVPVVLGGRGWKEIRELPLTAGENEGLRRCAELIRQRLVELDGWLQAAH